MPCKTSVAMASVCLRSSGSPDVQTQRNGPKPKEKMSLEEEEAGKVITIVKSNPKLWLFLPHDILDVRWVSEGRGFYFLFIFRRDIRSSPSGLQKKGVSIIPKEESYEK